MAGSYVPRILEGPPSDEGSYMLWRDGSVRVFHPAKLKPKYDSDLIRIKLKKFFLARWLELDGARSIVCAPADEVTAV